jgi:hypothetical protein
MSLASPNHFTHFLLILQKMEQLLQERLTIITDTGWREQNASTHLEALVEVGEQIRAAVKELQQKYQGELDPELHHFLVKQSYEKALQRIQELLAS